MERVSRRIFVALLAAALVGSVAVHVACSGDSRSGSAPSPAQSTTLRKGPYLVYPNDSTSMIVAWQTKGTPGSATLEWGPTDAYGQGPIALDESGSGPDQHQFSHRITGLDPGSLTHYRVTVDGVSSTGSFRTAPLPTATSVSIYAYGDTRQQKDHPNKHNQVVRGMLDDMKADAASRQTLCLHSGDVVTEGQVEASWDTELFRPDQKADRVDRLLATVPLLAVVGNHELYTESHDFAYAHGGELLTKYWPYPMLPAPYPDYPNATGPSPRLYFSFDYGPVHVVAIDAYKATKHPDQAAEQLEWLKSDLDGSSKPWKIALIHAPAFSAAKHASSGRDRVLEYVKSTLHDALKTRVRLVVAGHNHFYARNEVDGLTYLTLGGGGAKLSDFPATEQERQRGNKVAKKEYHFARIDISPTEMQVTVMDPSGAQLDSKAIPP